MLCLLYDDMYFSKYSRNIIDVDFGSYTLQFDKVKMDKIVENVNELPEPKVLIYTLVNFEVTGSVTYAKFSVT